jgi:hypothetical protein
MRGNPEMSQAWYEPITLHCNCAGTFVDAFPNACDFGATICSSPRQLCTAFGRELWVSCAQASDAKTDAEVLALVELEALVS